MASHYTKEEKIEILEQYLLNKKSPSETSRTLRAIWNLPRRVAISRSVFANIYRNFRTFGSVLHPRSCTPTVRTPENIQRVQEAAQVHTEANRNAGSERIGLELGISKTSAWRILKKDLKFKPYHLKLLHKLHEDDFDRRVEFSELFLERDQADPSWKDNILWSDEAIFSLAETVNRHNCVYWDSQNPNRYVEADNLGAQKVMVWAGVSSTRKVGPIFDQSITGATYLRILSEEILPVISQWEEFERLTFQQDGAPPHYAQTVRNFLDETFQEWIGRRGTIEWPARSPDLTPPDFFLWGYLKDRVFARSPRNIPELKGILKEEFDTIPQDMVQKACHSVLNRCQVCIEIEGKQIKLHKG